MPAVVQTSVTQEQLAALSDQIASKADASTLAAKADAATVSSLSTAIATKADAATTDIIPGLFTLATLPSATDNPNKRVMVTDLGGGSNYLQAKASDGKWRRIGQLSGQEYTAADVNGTLTPLVNGSVIIAQGALTANRVWTLSTTNSHKGAFFRVIRPLAVNDAFNLVVNGMNIPSGCSGDFHFDGTVWVSGPVTPTSRQQKRATTAVDGTFTWIYPVAYPTGVIPIIEALAEATAGSTDLINVQLDGPATNTQASFRVTRTAKSVVSLIGLTVLSIPTTVGATVLHLTARAPS